MQESLKERIYKYFLKNHTTCIASGEIQRLVMANTKHSPSNATRRLRELVTEGKLEVMYRKGFAYYKAKGKSLLQ